ncbi:MAG: hypothetical protein Kow0029_18460 [Candidatus Rifleibacteriota bacterium]
MKKVLSVIILLSFLGSMIVMTGCFGGSDGIGAVIGAAVFVLAISATGPGGAAAFAANNRASLRPSISITNDNVAIVVFPLDATGNKVGTGTTISGANLTFDQTTNSVKGNANISIADGYNQYLVEVRSGNNVLLKGIKYLKTSQKTGTVNTSVNATSTAQVMLYEKWNTSATTRTYGTFEFNLSGSGADVNGIATAIGAALQANPTNPDYSGIDAQVATEAAKVGTNPLLYTISGFVTAGDKVSGSTGTLLTLTRKSDGAFIAETTSAEGNFSLSIYDGTYVLTPTKQDHTFTPSYIEVTVNGDDVTGLNFQAAPVSFAASGK